MFRNVIATSVGIAVLAVALSAAVPAAAGIEQGTAPAKPAQPAAAAAKAAPARQALALTEEQKTKIRALREQQQTEARAARETFRAARQKLNTLQRAETFDENAFKAAAAAVATAQTDLLVQRARQRAQYLSILTPDQRERARHRREVVARAERRMRGFMMNGPGQGGRGRRQGPMGWGAGPGWGPNRGWGWNQGWGPWQGEQAGPWMMGPMGGPGAWGPGPMGQGRRNVRRQPPAAPAPPEPPKAPAAPAAPKK